MAQAPEQLDQRQSIKRKRIDDLKHDTSAIYKQQKLAKRLQYSYKALAADEIRILHLLPGQRGTPLRAILEHVSLADDSNPEYDAISYAWGSQDRPFDIELEGDTYLEITMSLLEALEQFRYTAESRALWADAICINQDDVLERSAQVEIMDQIFHRSTKVLVWLGKADEANDAAFAAIDSNSQVPIHWRLDHEASRIAVQDHLPHDPRIEESLHLSPSLYSFGLLLQRPWFSRLWVVQEVAFGRTVTLYCGARSTTWEKFVSSVRSFDTLRRAHLAEEVFVGTLDRGWLHLIYETMYQIELRRGPIDTSFRSGDFLTTMCNFSHKKCQEPHDRIYALRRFLGLHKVNGLKPDYRLSPGEIYRRAVEQCVIAAQPSSYTAPHVSLTLGLVGTEQVHPTSNTQDSTQRPSWVPDFHNLSERSRRKHDRYSLPHLAQFYWRGEASGYGSPPEQPRTRMSIMGQIFGVVVSILESSACPRESSHHNVKETSFQNQVLPKLLKWASACVEYTGATLSEPTKLQAILCCDDPHADTALPLEEFLHLDAVKRERPNAGVWLYESLRPFLAYNQHPRHDSGRLLCRAQIGTTQTFAWLPSSTEPGDCVAAFDGAPYAFALRQNVSNQLYRLLGDAHISGLPARIIVAPSTFGAGIRSVAQQSTRYRYAEPYNNLLEDPIGTWGWITLV